VRIHILGTMEAYAGERRLHLGPFKQRIALASLLCRANRVASVSELRTALWGDEPPRTAHKNLQVYMSALRKFFDTAGEPQASRIQLLHRPPGYMIQIGSDQLDALRFDELARAGRAAARHGDPASAANLLGRAIRMWRGAVLPDLPSAPGIVAAADRLQDQFLATYEYWAEAKLELGDHVDLVERLDQLTRRHPFRERLRHAHMVALFRSGRQAEALAQFDAVRHLLARELGLQPSPVLTRLYESILSGDQSVDTAAPGRIGPVSLRTGRTAHSKLARDVADFTGRTRFVDALLDVFREGGRGAIAAISGPAGVGKTTLTVHCAHRLGDRFPDGRVLICLRAADGRPRPIPDLLDDLLRGMGRTGPLPDEHEARAALVRESVAGRRTMFILDDAATEAQVRSVLEVTGDTAVLVTSRRHLAGLESAVHIVLDPMPETEAVELLGRLVGPERVAAEPSAALRLVGTCSGLPLAIRIVGAKLVGLRHLTLARYAERLADEHRILDELAAGDLKLRPRIAVSYRDLEAADQATLRRLASRPDPVFTAAEAADLLGTDTATAETAIERLIEAHLVRAHAGEVQAHAGDRGVSYSVPLLIRLFAREHGP
jgi:DNA-binding SARP family transcriptional activator